MAAEDHRNALHKGVDPYAMIRAVYAWVLNGEVQGASTIEQQFVRNVTGRFEKTVKRKIQEQALAIAVTRHRRKDQIACAYLSTAYYGHRNAGIISLKNHCGETLDIASDHKILEMIAKLKYPEPQDPSPIWKFKLQRRIKYIRDHSDQLSIAPMSNHLVD